MQEKEKYEAILKLAILERRKIRKVEKRNKPRRIINSHRPKKHFDLGRRCLWGMNMNNQCEKRSCPCGGTRGETKKKRNSSSSKMRAYRKIQPICECCKKEMAVDTHHIVPVSKEGSDKDDNLLAVCLGCHAEKHPEPSKALFTPERRKYNWC